MPSTLTWIIIVTLLNGFLAFAGTLFLFLSKKNLDKILIYLVAFAAGALLGGALFHFIPESLEQLSLFKMISITLAGFIIFFLLEKFLHWHHCHDDKCEHPYTYLLLYGDGIHNFIDGLIIASSFIISIPFGIITSFLIIIHELPQEISDFGVLIYGGFTKGKALFYNFLSQLTSVLGGVAGYFFLPLKDQAIFLLPIAAGGFLYIAVSDLIPEIFKEKNMKKLLINLLIIILGLILLYSAKLFAG